MKEIIYIQAGEFSNYTGTHFWNTQESYLSGDTDIDSDISFCESWDAQGISTLCPRLLMFDRKSNFGVLGTENALNSSDDSVSDVNGLWTHDVVEYRQEPISKSQYQVQMDDENKTASSDKPNSDGVVGDVRYWSDFSRVYYLPRSFQRLPNLHEWEESTSIDWSEGLELFKRFEEETELMDGALRLVVEDCDNPQGIQIMNDTSTFGGFMASFLASFRDEYLKLPSFILPLVSDAIAQNTVTYDVKTTKKLINEAFYLRTLNELSSMNIPIQEPTSWPTSVWGDVFEYPSGSTYHQSAILSAHVESCTLPFRSKEGHQNMSNICGLLNWRNTCPFGELSGVLPFGDVSTLDQRIVNFSSNTPVKSSRPYAQLNVTRGFSVAQLSSYAKWSAEQQTSNISSNTCVHASAYPMPSSFPRIKQNLSETASLTATLRITEVLSSIAASPEIAKSLRGYALLIENCVQRRSSLLASMDLTVDDLKELANDLWTMHDNALEENPNEI